MKLKIILPVIVLAWLAMPLAPALAQNADLKDQSTDILNTIGEKSGYGAAGEVTEGAIAQKAGNVIGLVLGFLGVVFLFLVVYSGIQWMTAGGNDEKITKARNRMIQAAIGIAIISLAYALTRFVVNRLQLNYAENGGGQARCSGDCVFWDACQPPYSNIGQLDCEAPRICCIVP
jgi:hypothetical protein